MKHDSSEWVSQFSFIARDEKETYHVNTHGKGHTYLKADAIFTWTMMFQVHEIKKLMVQYRLPMSETGATTSKRGWFPRPPSTNDPLLGQLGWGLLEFAGYTTETGSSWAGNVKNATFTIVTEPFERYLNQRTVFERLPPERPDDDGHDSFMKTFASRHEWWHRDIKPSGWKSIKGGVQWVYNDFKPKDPISINYYLTVFPRSADGVGPWVDGLLKTVPELRLNPVRLAMLKQVLLATYGQEPASSKVRKFVEDQVWYHPTKDFSLSQLSKEQQDILTELDRRLALIKKEPQE